MVALSHPCKKLPMAAAIATNTAPLILAEFKLSRKKSDSSTLMKANATDW